MSVDLPEPLPPEGVDLAAGNVEVDLVERPCRPESLRKSADLQDGPARRGGAQFSGIPTDTYDPGTSSHHVSLLLARYPCAQKYRGFLTAHRPASRREAKAVHIGAGP